MLLPVLGHAEGAVRHFECTFVQRCDGAGSCQADSGQVVFSMAPLSTAPDGSGKFEIRYDSVRASMQALSDTGPFHWKVGEDQHTLLVNSEHQMTWHRLHTDGAAETSIRFMNCRYRP